MTITPRSAVSAAAFVAAGALAATVLTGVAGAVGAAPAAGTSPSASSASASTTSAAATDRRPGRGLLRSLLHGEITVADGDGTAVVQVQRGEVVSASDTSVTVRSSDGFEKTYGIDSDTRIRRDRSDVAGSALQKGDTAVVRAQAGTADVVRAVSPEALTKLKDRAASRGGMGSGMASGMGAGSQGMGAGMMSGL